ncbi:MAG: hypothetical protein JSR15_04475 [Proteobacteria bacterium]|nr:hypothetical protein [Pseudomonadota bacterium]
MHRMIFRPDWRLAALAAGGALALGACTSQADLRKAELETLASQLPGEYVNPRQTLVILRLPSPMVGDQVFYVRETMADDSRRVISERVWNLDIAAGNRIHATTYALDEPDHWRGGVENPELFRSLLMRDLRSLPGCDMLWQKGPRGYTASGTNAYCPQSWVLEGNEISFSDKVNASGTIGAAMPPGGTDRYFHFRRSAGAQP